MDGVDHVALVAELAGGPLPRPVVAVGRWIRDAQRHDEAEIAVVVGDALQGQGLGTALARALADAARERGIARLTATMLADNEPARRMVARVTGSLTSRVSGGVRELTGELAPAAEGAAAEVAAGAAVPAPAAPLAAEAEAKAPAVAVTPAAPLAA